MATKKELQDQIKKLDEELAKKEAEESEASEAIRTKKDGTPDHRFKGQREGADEEEEADFTPAQKGEVAADGTHLTKDGKPDRRFGENRALTEEEAREKRREIENQEHQNQ